MFKFFLRGFSKLCGDVMKRLVYFTLCGEGEEKLGKIFLVSGVVCPEFLAVFCFFL